MCLDQSPRSNHPGLWHHWNPDPVYLDCNFGYNLFAYGIKWSWWKRVQRNKKDHGVHFEINNCSSIDSARQARIIMYTGTVGILLKKIGRKLTAFQVSNDQKEFQFDMTLASRLSDHQFKPLDAAAIWFSRRKGPLVFQLPVTSGFIGSLRRYSKKYSDHEERIPLFSFWDGLSSIW